MNLHSNLPSATIRVSSRAKHIRLKVSLEKGLEVVVPPGFDPSQVPHLLDKHQTWLKLACDRLEQQRQLLKTEFPDQLPETITLQAISAEWHINYQSSDTLSRVSVLEHGDDGLIVKGDRDNERACKLALQQWLCHQAHIHLVPWLRELSDQIDLPYGKTLVKSQKTRWASCSSQKTISINCKLLFLPKHLVRYIFIHELCHTVHLNHSSQFWSLVATKEPNYKQLNRELRSAWRYVPMWIEQLHE